MEKAFADTAAMRVAAPLAHRNDVDGLRAVAVLAILAFHLGITGFSGGFVGVDIFFVISGYVILRSILPDLESGRFSLGDFFVRRMRRILPALMVVLAATLAAGFVILSPAELEELAGSALATLAFGANLFFHDRTGYFASEAHTRPLLHMWSLGIEEQFYIVVPLALAALARFRGVSAALPMAILAVGSFAYGLAGAAAVSEVHAFYMPMARFWEIAAGGCIAVVERRGALPRNGSGWVASFGLLMIALAVLVLDSDRGGQQWVVVAVLGTAAVVVAGASERSWVAVTLASWPMTAIGRISYSIYLVHWPLIVFWRLYTARPLSPHEQVLIAVLTLALAAALSALVESPMRAGSRRIGNRPALAGLLAAGAVVAVAGTAIVLDRGASWRLQAPAREALALLQEARAGRPRCQPDMQWLAATSPFARAKVCRWNGGIAGTDFVIWGDSHAGALAPELSEMFADAGYKSGVSVGITDCLPIAGVTFAGHKFPTTCPQSIEAVLAAVARERPKIVVLVGRWGNVASDVRAPGDGWPSGRLVDPADRGVPVQLADALTLTVERIRASGAHVVLVGPVPEIDYNVPSTLVRALHGVGHLPPVLRTDFDRRQERVLGALARIRTLQGVLVVYPHTALCDDTHCAVAEGMRALYADDDHVSAFGAERVIALIKPAIARIGGEIAKSNAALFATPDE
jgi:peptidoglycan/LPS O-acetylase OafA/YrhL